MNQNIQTPLIFRPHKVMRIMLIVLWIILATFLFGIVYFMFTEVTTEGEQTMANYMLFSIGLTVFLFGTFVWIYNSKKLITDDKKITYKSILKEKSILLKDLKGYRKYNKIPVFYAKKNTGIKKIRTFANTKLTDWAENNFIDLDFEDYIEEEDKILADTSLGITALEREESLTKARRYANGLTLGFGAFMVIVLLFQISPMVFYYVGILGLTLIAIGLIVFKGLIRLERKTARASLWAPSLLTMLYLFFGWMGLGTHTDYSLLKYAFIISLVLSMLYIFVLVGKSNYNFKFVWIPLLLIFGLTLSGSTALNVILDFSTPKTHTTNISNITKNVGRKGFTTYKMHLNTWNTVFKNPSVRVTRKTFTNIPNGATVEITEHEGAFGKAWYTVHKDGVQLNNSDIGVNLGGDIKRLFD